ncbi:RNA dependent RNA polymerase-domain-containing protein [Hypoxylon crocopeplum]|nr:RNA dependent RNA polymerase-domain-containing protein [Hypoxylon crocopeplum]
MSNGDDDLYNMRTTSGLKFVPNSKVDEQQPSSLSLSSSWLSQESYSPTDEDTEALEEAWVVYTSSQPQQTDDDSLSHFQYSQELPPLTPSTRPTPLYPLLTPNPDSTGNRDGSVRVNQRSSLDLNGRATVESTFEHDLQLVWPQVPPGLHAAPLPVKWEFMRAALHCFDNPADIVNINAQYEEKWRDQNELWASLKAHPDFARRKLPDLCDSKAWNDSIQNSFRSDADAVVLTASMSLKQSAAGLEMLLELNPLRRERSCRIHRRFGSDRFLELRIPDLDSWKLPGLPEEGLENIVARWLSHDPHCFLGRNWAAFWVRNEGRKPTTKVSDVGPDPKVLGFERVSFFATDDVNHLPTQRCLSVDGNDPRRLPKCTRDEMLQWLLQFDKNWDESYLKLFSRISLGLTKTAPIITFKESQIRRRENDIKSPTGDVMNNGIGRVSLSVMKKLRDVLDLGDTPCAVQARLGSAKGMWIADTTESSQDDWIETYPEQRKWDCDWSDECHRTLEIKSYASPLKSANLNLQFLPILEDRAIDKTRMRNTIGEHLATELGRDLESLKTAIKNPQLFRQWVWESSIRSESRIHDTPFLAGLPDYERDKMAFLIDGGFDPMKQKYLQDLVFRRQREKCERLEKELRIKITRSTYAFMVVDFLGVLAPNEVHLCFSSKFADDSDEYYDLDGMDVLIARSPAHLPSDIQKVRAVFKPELRHLKDVIIFPRTGDTPLADKLSGGDYDGDKAWVCWEPEIVGNFKSRDLPDKPNFSTYFERDRQEVRDFVGRGKREDGISTMVEKAFAFSLRPKLLGICTSYKERLCYHYNSISKESVINLSWFLGKLADQTKNGIIFGDEQWKRLRNDIVGEKLRLDKPAYKTNFTGVMVNADHIIDHLRFVVAKGIIENELKSLNDFYKADPAYLFDADVTGYWNEFEKDFGKPDRNGILRAGWLVSLRMNLWDDLEACCNVWRTRMAAKKDFRLDVLHIYDMWRNIEPFIGPNVGGDAVALSQLQQPRTHPPELNTWQLLKASMTFKLFYATNTSFVWQIAGRQLQHIKGLKSSADVGKAPVLVVPSLYAALRPDNKYIRRIVAQGARAGDGDPEEEEDSDLFEDALEDFADLDLDGLDSTVGNLSVG